MKQYQNLKNHPPIQIPDDLKEAMLKAIESVAKQPKPTRVKRVFISKCMDCPVECCEHRRPCGGIPEECELDDAKPSPIKASYRCRRCKLTFVREPTSIVIVRIAARATRSCTKGRRDGQAEKTSFWLPGLRRRI